MQGTRLLIFLFISLSQCFGKKTNPDENAGVADTNLFEGDIILNSRQRMAIKLGRDLDGASSTRAAAARRRLLWSNGVLPYTIDKTISAATYYVILNAMRVWSQTTCIKFKRRTRERDYVHFFKGRGCWSRVGRGSRRQKISIGNGCSSVGIVVHEIAHALGFWHEQSRPDRDHYVIIKRKNIKRGKKRNFKKYRTSRINSLGVPYDYGSVMHYGAYYFSKNGKPTIVVKRAGVTIGQRFGPSRLDFKQMNLLYKCMRPNCAEKTTSGQCCVLPFKYKRVTYYSCTNAYHHRAWCSLDSQYKGRWGNCAATGCQPKTTSRKCCAIPFKYRRVWYHSCTSANHHRAWCSLDPVYKRRWGNCAARTGCKVQTTSRKCCAIPFKYRRVWYHSCTSANHHRAWCSLDRVYRGRWGNCAARTGCKVQTTSRKCCAIPFKYRRVWYHSCTSANHHRAWCSLDRVYRGRWGNCQ